MRIFMTGDKHGSFYSFSRKIKRMGLTDEDVVVILGDHGINFNNWQKDYQTREYIKKNIAPTLFVIRGNHDIAPEEVFTCKWLDTKTRTMRPRIGHKEEFFGNEVWVEENYPTIKYAIDGNVYEIWDKNVLVIGGGYSVDRDYRLQKGFYWNLDEQLTEEQMKQITLTYMDNKIDYIFSHVAPNIFEKALSYSFLPYDFVVDRTMEMWMNELYLSSNNKIMRHYCGHYHINNNFEECGTPLTVLFEEIVPFGWKAPEIEDKGAEARAEWRY